MTIQQLIDILQVFPDKSIEVCRYYDGIYTDINSVEIKELHTQDDFHDWNDDTESVRKNYLIIGYYEDL